MNIKELKEEFITNLSEVYPSEEVLSFFTILAEKYLGLSRIQIALVPETEISAVASKKIKKAMQRLNQFEPIQYIIGETEFHGLLFKVDSNVLIPRPETEELVSWILDDVEGLRMKNEEKRKKLSSQNTPQLSILDIGSGSGCISISLAHSLPEAQVTGVDISEGALQIAKQNAILNNVGVEFIEADVLNQESEAWSQKLSGMEFDLIVSNPPYIREQEKEQIEPNVIKHEPAIALFVEDDDPLLFYREIAQLSMTYLKSGAALYFEINQYLYKDLMSMLKHEGFNDITLRKDIFGKERMIKCRKDE